MDEKALFTKFWTNETKKTRNVIAAFACPMRREIVNTSTLRAINALTCECRRP